MNSAWPIRPLRALAEVSLGRQRSPDRAEGPNMVPYLRAANVKDGALDLEDVMTMDFSPVEQSTYSLYPGDVLVTEGAGSLAAVGASAVWNGEVEGVVCYQNTLLRMRPRPGHDPRFLMWWARHAYGSGLFASIAGGANIYHLGAERVRWLPAAIPDLAHQRAIADYLDAETARIDGLVVARRRQLESIQQRRSTATDRIMAQHSRGSNWPQVRLKYVVQGFVDTLHATAPDEEDGPGYIVGTGSIKGGNLDLSSARRCSAETLDLWTSRATPRPGEVLLTREAPAGEAALVPDGVPLAAGQRVVLIQTDETRLLPQLLVRGIYSQRAAEFFDLLGRETTVTHLNMSDIGAIPVVVPPLPVQHDVAEAIDHELRMLDEITATMKRQVELLLERRQALITAAVTGQLQIPGVAA